MNDPVAAYFAKLPQIYKCQFVQKDSGANFCFQKRLTLACELAGASGNDCSIAQLANTEFEFVRSDVFTF